MILKGVILLAAAVTLTGCVHTEPFTDEAGNPLPGSIAVMERVDINGVPQMLWFRGRSVEAPALLILHGGPGASEAALFRHYNAGLEQHFLVVNWEQRGTGRSFHADLAPATLTVAQLLEDLDAVVELVRERFGHSKVILLGHSWGTVLGTRYAHEQPDKVLAYIGTGQIADAREGQRLSHAFALERAEQEGHRRALERLRAIGPPPHSVEQDLEIGRWVQHFGGEFHADMSTGSLIWAALRTDEASLWDLVQFGRGNAFSLEHLHDELDRVRLDRCCTRFEVPVYFLLGRHDHNTPAVLAARYFEALDAPDKRLIWFEHSAHNAPFEEPERFNRVLIDELLPSL